MTRLREEEGEGEGWARVQHMWFPLWAWELRIELAGQGDPASLPSPAKAGRSKAPVQGYGPGTQLPTAAAPPESGLP